MKYLHTIKLSVIALALPLLLTPQGVAAQQTTSDTQLLATIQILLERVQELQVLLNQQQATVTGIDPLEDFAGAIIRVYQIADVLELPAGAAVEHDQYVEQLRTLLPEQYSNYIDQFVVFTDHPGDIAAFVAVTTDGRTAQWAYGVSAKEIAADPTSNLSAELMIHEFAHIFSLDQLINSTLSTDICHEYFFEQGCFAPGSYLDQFVESFWDTELLDELVLANDSRNQQRALARLYDRYDSEFVTPYAATEPAEDFAESFTWYVLGMDAERGSVAQEKIDFMTEFSAIRSYKQQITNNL